MVIACNNPKLNEYYILNTCLMLSSLGLTVGEQEFPIYINSNAAQERPI